MFYLNIITRYLIYAQAPDVINFSDNKKKLYPYPNRYVLIVKKLHKL